MVLPARIARAARLGYRNRVAAWLEEGGGDVNDVDSDGHERTLLIRATYGPCKTRTGMQRGGIIDQLGFR